jgi:hypothetical protein
MPLYAMLPHRREGRQRQIRATGRRGEPPVTLGFRQLGRKCPGPEMHTFGFAAPLKVLLAKFGFTAEKVLAAAKDQIAKLRGKPV